MKKFLAFILLFLIMAPLLMYGQTDTAKVVVSSGGFLSKIPGWVYVALGAAYEIVVRVIPTTSNLSIIGLVIKLIQSVLPNKSTDATKPHA
jgi:hypothetical protein